MNFHLGCLLLMVFLYSYSCENDMVDMSKYGDTSSFADVLNGGTIDDSEIGFEDDQNLAKQYGSAISNSQTDSNNKPSSDSLSLPFSKLLKTKRLIEPKDSQQQQLDADKQAELQKTQQQQQQKLPEKTQQRVFSRQSKDRQPIYQQQSYSQAQQQQSYPKQQQQQVYQQQQQAYSQPEQPQQQQLENIYERRSGSESVTPNYNTNQKYQSGTSIKSYQVSQVLDKYQDVYDTSYKNIGLNAFGQPGVDFPIYAAVPKTDFNCKDQQYPGYYADTEAQCQVFHICQADGRQDAFLCPNATLFNQMTFVCEWYFNVDCNSARSYYALNANLYEITKDKYTSDYNSKINDQQKLDIYSA